MDAVTKLDQHYRGLQRRFFGSVAIFALFCIASLWFTFSGGTSDDFSMAVSIVLIVSSLVILPRNTAPLRWPTGETPEDQDAIDRYREELRSMQLRGTWMRIAYLGVTVVLLLVLPLLAG